MSQNEAMDMLERIRKHFLNSVEALLKAWNVAQIPEGAHPPKPLRADVRIDFWPALFEISAFLFHRIDVLLSSKGAPEKLRQWLSICAVDPVICPYSESLSEPLLRSRSETFEIVERAITKQQEVNPNAAGAMMCAALINESLQKGLEDDAIMKLERRVWARKITPDEAVAGALLGKATDETAKAIAELLDEAIRMIRT